MAQIQRKSWKQEEKEQAPEGSGEQPLCVVSVGVSLESAVSSEGEKQETRKRGREEE